MRMLLYKSSTSTILSNEHQVKILKKCLTLYISVLSWKEWPRWSGTHTRRIQTWNKTSTQEMKMLNTHCVSSTNTMIDYDRGLKKRTLLWNQFNIKLQRDMSTSQCLTKYKIHWSNITRTLPIAITYAHVNHISSPLIKEKKKDVQQVLGSFVYHERTSNMTILCAHSVHASK